MPGQSAAAKQEELEAVKAWPLLGYTLTGGASVPRALRGQEGNRGLFRLRRLGVVSRAPGWPAGSGGWGARSPRA